MIVFSRPPMKVRPSFARRSGLRACATKPLRRRRREGGSGGFTLLEVLVAFTVLAISLGVLFEIFSTGMRASRSAEEYTRATLLAESKLAAIGIEGALEEGETTGAFGDGYNWRVAIRPYRLDGSEEEGPPPPIEAYEVVVTVAWGEGSGERSVSLTTLRLKSGATAGPGTGRAP